MKRLIQSFAFIVLLTACNETELDRDVNLALIAAGGNRSELVAVLDHYCEDAEKLTAAKFLIANMPGHYSYAETHRLDVFYDALDSLLDVMTDSSRTSVQSAIKELYLAHRMDNLTVVPDIRVIKSDFLIGNIDRAFRQWRTKAWCKNLDFDHFCEYLLPYKVAETQSLQPWWSEFEDIVTDSLDRMSSCSLFRVSSYQAAEVVNNTLKQHFVRDLESYEIPQLYYRPKTRLRVPFGTCDELCQSGLIAFRAAGVPVTIDNVPVWGYGNRGHTWGVVYAPNGKDVPFVPIHMSPYIQHKINETVSKAYRRTYARNKYIENINASGEWIPPVFRNVFQRDVSSLYADVCDVTVNIEDTDSKYVYLCTSSRSKWKPVAVTEYKHGKATFKDVGKGIVFLVAAYDDRGAMRPLTNPIKLDRDGNLCEIEAHCDSLIDVTLYRKAPLLEYAWNMAVLIENGIFEASDDPSFTHPIKVGAVNTPADQAGELKVDAGAHRYWRFVQRGDIAGCYIGEITFLNVGNTLNGYGRTIGNYPGGEGLCDGNRAFDGDVLTAVSFTHENEAWVGMDFGEPTAVDKIRYSPRSDGNMIEPGDEYELTYWSDSRWKSLGCKTATTVSIEWNGVPAGGVYVLLNKTKGNSVRIFLLNENGEQEWW